MALERRLNAFRADLADARLRGRVTAERFVDGAPARVATPICRFRDAPDLAASTSAEKLLGEPLLVFETAGDWVWAQSEQDGYVGYARRADIADGAGAPRDLRVTAVRTHLYAEPSLKTQPIGWAPLGARLAAGDGPAQARFRPLAEGGGWVYASHVSDTGAPPPWAADWVAVAEAFGQTPYLWGGESVEGIDCSGLTHIALEAFGRTAPRDSDLQALLGEPLEAEAPLQRGDLIFWKGHVGVMRDAELLLHANAWSMSTISEPLAEAVARIAAQNGGPVTARRRLAERS